MGGKVYTLPKSIISNHCDTIWDIYAGERVATDKSLLSNRCDTIWDIYACEGFALTVFVNSFISTVYGLKGRKMMARIL